MKKSLLYILPLVGLLIFLIFQMNKDEKDPFPEVTELRQKHREFLKNKPDKVNGKLSRKEKIKKLLPPNKYYELMSYLTMNPALGYPEPYKVQELHEKLMKRRENRSSQKAPGKDKINKWFERGPSNVGGRTRVLLFDPTDDSGKRVYAGAISGGLWVNNDITNENSRWEQLEDLPANMNISAITVDPRDPQVWYIGTGEQYTAGDVVGTGVYKTIDGGQSWNKVLDVDDFATDRKNESQLVVGGIHFINDIIAWDNGTSTEIFIGVSTHIYSNAANPTNFLGFFDRGLYGSKDGGDTWQKAIGDDSFNDFEVDAAGNLWVATTNSPGAGEDDHGGKIFFREKGAETVFSQITTVPNVMRTEIEASATNPQKFYILAETAENTTGIWTTNDGFATITSLAIPNDVDDDIPPNDFARGQAFYNLMIESNPTNDQIIYAGGIDLFRSTNGGNSWDQISKWTDDGNLKDLPVSIIHADQHVMRFRPGNNNQAIFGNDGGVSFANNLSAASTSEVFISPEKNYITTQFYSIAVAPTTFASGDYFLGGTQDNGTVLIQNGDPISLGVLGGDGAHAFYDQVDTDYFVANLVYNNLIVVYDYSEGEYRYIADNEDDDGFFINPQALDSNFDQLYSNGPEGTLYRYDDLDNLDAGEDETARRRSFTNSLLDASITAMNVSTFTKTQANILAGLITGRLLRIEATQSEPETAIWKDITGNQFVGSISDVEFGKNESEIYVTFYNYGVRSIWYTENGLDAAPTWVSKEGNLPDMPILTILPNPLNPDEVIVGTELGVWATQNFSDANPVWEQSYNGMSDVKVTDLDLRKGDNTVFAASYGRGMFSGKFTDSGNPVPGGETVKGLFVLPTISNGNLRIISELSLGETKVFVFDVMGQKVAEDDLDIPEGEFGEINLTHLQPGLYFVRVESKSISKTEKVIIQ